MHGRNETGTTSGMMNRSIDVLLDLMATLRDPDVGCPWDVAQTPASIVPFTIEEAYEVADAVDRGDPDDLREELGDLLFQVVFQARMAEEAGRFDFADVAAAIGAKLIRRHPHVFAADGLTLAPERRPEPAMVEAAWARIKAEERARKRSGRAVTEKREFFDDVPLALPALSRAEKISRRAAGQGFDWSNAGEVIAKVREETDEVAESLAVGDQAAVMEEIGDLLFSVANLARHAGVDAEEALRRGTVKFERRFNAMAAQLETEGGSLASSDLAAMEAAWQTVKRAEG